MFVKKGMWMLCGGCVEAIHCKMRALVCQLITCELTEKRRSIFTKRKLAQRRGSSEHGRGAT
jgi:hypothetical protein